MLYNCLKERVVNIMWFTKLVVQLANSMSRLGDVGPKLFLNVHKSTVQKSDQDKVADDWKRVGSDMRKAIIKYDARVAR